MQFINDDIDQLYRRAAEDYPLKITGGDWTKVFNALQQDENGRNQGNNNQQFRSLFPALLLIFTLPFFFQHNFINERKDSLFLTESQNRDRLQMSRPSITASSKDQNEKSETKNTIVTVRTAKIRSSINTSRVPGITFGKVRREDNRTNRTSAILPPSNETMKINSVPFRSGSIKNELLLKKWSGPVFHNITGSILNLKNESINKINKSENANGRRQHFYLGLIAGMDVSNVKLQRMSKTGYTAGVLIGYHLTPAISVESGAFLDQKSYYSDGEYFKANLYPNTKIQTVEGTCKM